ncbi:uncharacterized protein LOC123549087 [Mercenaria mercenaria]|uniref:uncharacterized protein LOC123549087 n=1 Tax=Mercenaria mercenaria TaxID=6596 RepID=UPI00234E8FC5|nr:uncharacterized protein LOC123549087 [Mercenaria mercenaria]
MESPFCLYHKDKDSFSRIQKELQKSGWIPRTCAHRLAMAVCSCRKNKQPMPSRDEFLDSQAKLEEQVDPLRAYLPKHLLTCLDDCMNSATETDYSYCQFISILVKAKLGDFSMLSRAVLSTNSKISERDLQREISRKKKLTPHQIEIIKNKRKRKMNSVLIKLPVFPGNFTKLQLDFVKESKGYLEPQYNLNNQNFESKKIETWVKVWGDPTNMKTLSERLTEEARAVQKRMDSEWRERRTRNAERRRYLASVYDDDDDEEEYENTVMSGNVKEHLTDDFSLKVQKSAKNKTKTVLAKAQTSVLQGGHCLQCYKPFTDLHDGTSCTFHEGFIVSQELSNKRIWSCCSDVVNEDMDAYTVHSTTGCSTSPVHNWRTHAKSKGKDRENQFYNSHKYH